MSRSFFNAAMIITQARNEHYSSRAQNLDKQLVVDYLSEPENVVKLKSLLSHKRLSGENWFRGDDKGVIEEYISDLPRSSLRQLIHIVKLTKIKGFYYLPSTVISLIKGLMPIINNISTIFNRNQGGFLGGIFSLKHSWEISKKPDLELNTEEKNQSMQYNHIFVDAAKDNKRYNQLYREIIKTARTQEQVLAGLLNYIKGLEQQKLFLEASSVLVKVEKALLRGGVFRDYLENSEVLFDQIRENLLAALKAIEHSREALNQDQVSVAELEQLKVAKINNAARIFQKVVMAVAKKDRQLEEAPLTKAQREQIAEFVITHKRKLLFFILQTKAFSKEDTLNPQVEWLGASYRDVSGNQYPTYLDFWLSRVPNLKNDISGEERVEDASAEVVTGLEINATVEQQNWRSVQVVTQDSKNYPLLKQFKPIPFNIDECKATTVAMPTLPAESVNDIINYEQELKTACDTVFDLHKAIARIDSNIKLLEDASKRISNDILTDQKGSDSEHLKIVNICRSYNFKEVISQKERARSQALNEMYLLQKMIVQNIINLTKIEIDLKKPYKLNNLEFGRFSEEEQNILWQRVQKHLGVYNEEDSRSKHVKETFNVCLSQGGLSVELKDFIDTSKFSPSYDDEGFLEKLKTMLKQQVNNLQQKTLEIQAKNHEQSKQGSNKESVEYCAVNMS